MPWSRPRSAPKTNTRREWSKINSEAASRMSSVASRATVLSGIAIPAMLSAIRIPSLWLSTGACRVATSTAEAFSHRHGSPTSAADHGDQPGHAREEAPMNVPIIRNRPPPATSTQASQVRGEHCCHIRRRRLAAAPENAAYELSGDTACNYAEFAVTARSSAPPSAMRRSPRNRSARCSSAPDSSETDSSTLCNGSKRLNVESKCDHVPTHRAICVTATKRAPWRVRDRHSGSPLVSTPGVDQLDASVREIIDVARRADRSVRQADSGDLRVGHTDRYRRTLPSQEDVGIAFSRRTIERQHRATPPIGLERRFDTLRQLILAPAVRETPHTGQQFRERHRRDRDITGQRREPFDHARLRRRPEDLRDDIRVEDDHSNSTARATSSRAGTGRSSTPLTSCATDSNAIPIWGRRAALVRISRTSASMERPCSLACVASCRFTPSSSPRTIMDDISDRLLCYQQ